MVNLLDLVICINEQMVLLANLSGSRLLVCGVKDQLEVPS